VERGGGKTFASINLSSSDASHHQAISKAVKFPWHRDLRSLGLTQSSKVLAHRASSQRLTLGMMSSKHAESYAALGDPESMLSGLVPGVPPTAVGASVVTSIINLATAVLGAGLLGVPFGYAEAGWLLASFMMLGSGFLSCFTMHLLSVVRYGSEIVPQGIISINNDE